MTGNIYINSNAATLGLYGAPGTNNNGTTGFNKNSYPTNTYSNNVFLAQNMLQATINVQPADSSTNYFVSINNLTFAAPPALNGGQILSVTGASLPT